MCNSNCRVDVKSLCFKRSPELCFRIEVENIVSVSSCSEQWELLVRMKSNYEESGPLVVNKNQFKSLTVIPLSSRQSSVCALQGLKSWSLISLL